MRIVLSMDFYIVAKTSEDCLTLRQKNNFSKKIEASGINLKSFLLEAEEAK